MTDDPWIVVPNWTKFQHYGGRRDAPWIKVYNELNSRDEWLALAPAERGVLVTTWIEYSRSSGVLRRSKVATLCGARAREKHWKALSDAGFIEFSASKPLALRALAREKKKEKEKDARAREDENRPNAAAYTSTNSDGGLEQIGPRTLPPEVRDKLRELGLLDQDGDP